MEEGCAVFHAGILFDDMTFATKFAVVAKIETLCGCNRSEGDHFLRDDSRKKVIVVMHKGIFPFEYYPIIHLFAVCPRILVGVRILFTRRRFPFLVAISVYRGHQYHVVLKIAVLDVVNVQCHRFILLVGSVKIRQGAGPCLSRFYRRSISHLPFFLLLIMRHHAPHVNTYVAGCRVL